MPETQAVFIVDPDPESRAKVAQIAAEMEIPADQYSSAEAFLKERLGHPPGCLVVEFRLPGISGLELQKSLATGGVSPPMIFITGHAVTASIVQAMQHGAITVLEKPFAEQDLRDAIGKALSRDQTIRRVDAQHSELRGRMARLTQKERNVLDLMVKGTSNKSIARQLDVSVRTVETRRHQIFKKTCTDSIAQLMRLIAQLGFDDEDEGLFDSTDP